MPDLNEAKTRALLINPQLERAGWNLSDHSQVQFEVPVKGYDPTPWNGFTDFCLYDVDGSVLALIIGSLVETSLSAAIVYALGRHDKSQTFASRIRAARTLNLIGTETFENLEVIREVRNTFAHAMPAIQFDTPEVTNACNRLIISENYRHFVRAETQRRARFQYGYASQTIFLTNLNFAFTRSTLDPRRTPPSTPILP